MRLLKYMKNYLGQYGIAIFAMIAAIALDMFQPPIQRRIVDEVIIGGKIGLLQGLLLGLAAITVGRAVLGFIKEYLFDLTSSNVVLHMRKDLFDHVQKLSFSFFDRTNTGELMSRIKEDTENVQFATAFGFMLFAEQIIYFVTASALLFTLSWKLALLSLAITPIIGYMALQLEKKVGVTFEKLSDQRAVLNTTAQENLAGVRLVKAFGREKYEIQKFLEQNKENYRLNLEQAAIWAKFFPGIEFLTNLVIVLVTCVGGLLVIGQEMTIGTLVAFGAYIYMLIWPMRMIGWLTNILAQCKASLGKIDTLFREEPVIKDPERPFTPETVAGHVVFEHVCFAQNGVTILQDINLVAKPGATIAIMGATGSGKSSLINLIGRFYDCTSGGVYVDGVNVKDWGLQALRNHIAVVMQDTFLFSDTVQENIMLGLEPTTVEALLPVMRDAKVDDFVREMPQGYESIIGERGIGLSGGQKQRISIARALARKAKILILDDATSALDMETEYEIQRALERRQGMTTFIIAHRISAVKNADEIIILEDGQIVERGTHAQLLALKGRYYETYMDQFHGVAERWSDELVQVSG
jgi:ATP-binding cassette subfamily B multidrug efflux pump